MHFRWLKPVPLLIIVAVVTVITTARLLVGSRFCPQWRFLAPIEEKFYDWRMEGLYRSQAPVATNLAAVFIDDQTLNYFSTNNQYVWPLPRQLYGRAIRELSAQGAKAIGFDILFAEPHPRMEHTDVLETNRQTGRVTVMGSDEFLAAQIREAGSKVVLAVMGQSFSNTTTGNIYWEPLLPADLFRTNGARMAHIVSQSDRDGVLRRTFAFKEDGSELRSGRYWMLAIALAASELGLDIDRAEIRDDHLVLTGSNGVRRAMPLDERKSFLVNWAMTWNDPRLHKISLEEIVEMDARRQRGETGIEPVFRDKLVVIGSIGTGNNLSDIGATSLSKETFLVSKHWNALNQVLVNRFIRECPLWGEVALIVLMGCLGAVLTWAARPWLASALVVATVGLYAGAAWVLFLHHLFWMPIVTPVVAALLCCHFATMTYRVVFEQREQRRIKGIFSKVVAPDVVKELLAAEKLALGGAQRRMTVFFADVRGFTDLTDTTQARAEEHVRQQQLSGPAATEYYDAQARELLATVNLYLSTVAGIIKDHGGTLDKYMGDCVMAFWGAPTENPRHAVECVRAAMAAQTAIRRLNEERERENQRRMQENLRRAGENQPPLPMLSQLQLGSGINTGTVTVGLMGSEEHLFNYTVFGREVNLASRLEGVSGRGRIIIGEATYQDLLKDDPTLAARCVPCEAVAVKGFRHPVQVYEVPWKAAGGAA